MYNFKRDRKPLGPVEMVIFTEFAKVTSCKREAAII